MIPFPNDRCHLRRTRQVPSGLRPMKPKAVCSTVLSPNIHPMPSLLIGPGMSHSKSTSLRMDPSHPSKPSAETRSSPAPPSRPSATGATSPTAPTSNRLPSRPTSH